ncbi:Hypothetical_protein [Hexamita inflata]|uniref:Hypothetical_protein n=1 Tax=Hexamita inflata TaxID=28002 RepID=A0AA86UK38_9EUKA|nr:Hypothetical protein HINF_LOCUS49095 [Hexamita inflata]
MLLFGFFEFTHHCRRCIKLTLQFSLQFGDLLFERLNFFVIAFRVGDYFGLGGFVRFFFVDVSSSLSLPFSAVCVDFFLVFLVLWAFSKFFSVYLGFAGTSLIVDCVAYLHHSFFVKVIKDFPVVVSAFELNITVRQGGIAVGSRFDILLLFGFLIIQQNALFISIYCIQTYC